MMHENFEPSDVAEILEGLPAYGRKGAGGNLYLRKDANGRGRWIFHFRFLNQDREITLGVFPELGLETARVLRDDAVSQLRGGYMPTCETSAERRARRERAEARCCPNCGSPMRADGWIKIKRIGGVKFVPATALELRRCEDAEELVEEGYGFIEFSGLDGEPMGRTRHIFDSIADWIEDVLGDLTEKQDRRKRGAFLCALLRWELLPDLQVALQRTKFPWAFKEAGASVTP